MTNNSLNENISSYYQRNRWNKYGNSYYLMPKDDVPMAVLNNPTRFLIVTFDQKDNYIVIGNQRYYLNKFNSIKCTPNDRVRTAIVDLDALNETKVYPFKSKYRNKYTTEFRNFDELRSLAKDQWKHGGTPWVRQQAVYDRKTNECRYYYELSCGKDHQFN